MKVWAAGGLLTRTAYIYIYIYISAEQYTGIVIIPQYYFPIPSNFLNTAVP